MSRRNTNFFRRIFSGFFIALTLQIPIYRSASQKEIYPLPTPSKAQCIPRGLHPIKRLRASCTHDLWAGGSKGNASHAGERCDRRQWRKKGAERVAAVGGQRRRIVAKAHTGYRNRTMFVRIRLRCPAAASPDKAGLRLADRGTCLPPRFICRRQRSGAQPLGPFFASFLVGARKEGPRQGPEVRPYK